MEKVIPFQTLWDITLWVDTLWDVPYGLYLEWGEKVLQTEELTKLRFFLLVRLFGRGFRCRRGGVHFHGVPSVELTRKGNREVSLFRPPEGNRAVVLIPLIESGHERRHIKGGDLVLTTRQRLHDIRVGDQSTADASELEIHLRLEPLPELGESIGGGAGGGGVGGGGAGGGVLFHSTFPF